MNHQSSQGGSQRIRTDMSWLNQDGGSETGFRDKLIAVDGSSNKICAT